jgi:hypothetical protein
MSKNIIQIKACQYTDRRKLASCSDLQIDADASLSIDNEVVDDLSNFVHNSSTRIANIPRPGPSKNSEFARKALHCRF